jgi:hypothetical protein
LSTTLLLAPTVQAAEPSKGAAPTCAERVRDCEALLKNADEVIYKQADVITYQENLNRRLERSLDASLVELSKRDAWYRDPALIGAAGFVLGVALGAYVSGGR